MSDKPEEDRRKTVTPSKTTQDAIATQSFENAQSNPIEEKGVHTMLTEGLTSMQLSEKFGISYGTIKDWRRKIVEEGKQITPTKEPNKTVLATWEPRGEFWYPKE